MKLLSVSCSHCGAPLEVPKKARLVTCSYCNARLQVEQAGGVYYTEVLESLDERTRQIAEDVSDLKLHQQLERLDREWMLEREQLKIRDQDGQLHVPSVAGSLIGAGVAVVFGVIWISMASRMGAPGFFPLFGVLFIVVAIAMGAVSLSKANAYQRSRQNYERQRRRLVDQFHRPGGKPD